MTMIRFFAIALLLTVPFLSACTGAGLLAGAAATTGIAAAQEGGIPRAVSDSSIKLSINEKWFSYDVNTFAKLKTRVKQGRVLLTGVVQDPAHRVEAVRLVWQVDGVKQVINEIRVAESEGIKGFVKDGYITSRLRTQITFDREVQSINYSIDTIQSIVYLMGFAQNQAELNKVIETARTIPGVKQVVSYVKLVGVPVDSLVEESNQSNAVISEPQYDPQPMNEPAPMTTQPQINQQPAMVNEPSIEDQYYNQ